MSLITQFLITLSLPVAFLLLLFVSWYRTRGKEGAYLRYWLLGLLLLAIWASSIPSYYVGTPFPQEAAFYWRVAGRHLLSLFGLVLLLATATYVPPPRRQRQFALGLALVLWLLALLLDPALFSLPRTLLAAAGEPAHPFMLWAGVWVASWLIPLLAAWIISWKAAQNSPRSLYRNRINYWTLTVMLFLAGGGLAVIQEPGQPFWQEVGAVVQIVAAFWGMRTITRNDLPDLRLSLRYLGVRLASSLLIFGITWLVLWSIAHTIPRRGNASTNLDLIFTAALFAALFIVLNQLGQWLVRRVMSPDYRLGEAVLTHQPQLPQSLLDPQALAQLTLHIAQANLTVENAQILLAEEGPAASVVFRPVASLAGGAHGPPVALAGDSPLTRHLRRTPPTPLYAYDLENLEAFATLPRVEKEQIEQHPYQLLIALQSGGQLVGLLMVGDRYTGAPYNTTDATGLQTLAEQVGPLLWQARQLHNLERLNRHLFDKVQALTQERRYLQELSALYSRLTELASPDLRAPIATLNQELAHLQERENGAELGEIQQTVAELRLMVDQLIVTADRVQQQRAFAFGTFRLDEAISQAVRNLATMAEARQVKVKVEIDPRLPPIQGDERRLVEAIQYLLHNAIKFNKIGGEVRIESAPAGNELYLHVHDGGVGIPEERLAQIWKAFGPRENGRSRSSRPGLGLLLAQFIVRAHGGRVEARSQYGAGSRFSIYLPLVLEQSRQ